MYPKLIFAAVVLLLFHQAGALIRDFRNDDSNN